MNNIESIATDVQELAPTLLVVGNLNEVKEVFLVIEKTIVCQIRSIDEPPLLLLAAFYSFNISYPKGLETMYKLLEYCILGKKSGKISSSLANFITMI